MSLDFSKCVVHVLTVATACTRHFFFFLSFTLFSILELYAHFFVLAVFGVAESIWANDQRNCFFFHQ